MIKSGATTGNLAIVETDEEFSIWSPLAVIRVHNKKAVARFVLAAMDSKEFQASVQLFWSFGTQQNIGMKVIENLPIPLPPLSEQQDIAAYLDRETAKIDALSAKITMVIDRLREYRTSLISAAVTGKIDVREAGLEYKEKESV
jgi:type I restriction enzyme S subunit